MDDLRLPELPIYLTTSSATLGPSSYTVTSTSGKRFVYVIQNWNYDLPVSLDNLVCTAPTDEPKRANRICVPKIDEEEYEMNTEDNLQRTKIQYLQNRLSEAEYEKSYDFQKQFGLQNDAAPATAREVVKRIQDGKFILPEITRDGGYHSITWRDPAVKQDVEGYNAAWEKAQELVQSTKDIIMIKTPAEGLAALQAFETSDLTQFTAALPSPEATIS